MVKVGREMLSHTFSGRLGKKSFSADNIRILTDFTEPVDSYSHRFGQDLENKMTQLLRPELLLSGTLRKKIK